MEVFRFSPKLKLIFLVKEFNFGYKCDNQFNRNYLEYVELSLRGKNRGKNNIAVGNRVINRKLHKL